MNRASSIKRKTFWLVTAIILLIVLVFMFGENGLWNTLMLKNRVAKLEAKVDSLEDVNQRMGKHIEALSKEDLRVIEEEARSHGMIKPGEKVYLLRSKDKESQPHTPPTQ